MQCPRQLTRIELSLNFLSSAGPIQLRPAADAHRGSHANVRLTNCYSKPFDGMSRSRARGLHSLASSEERSLAAVSPVNRAMVVRRAARQAGWSSEQQAQVPGTDQPWACQLLNYAWNDEPQPQVPDTFGLPNLKPEPFAPST
jgi:hypothetical protein